MNHKGVRCSSWNDTCWQKDCVDNWRAQEMLALSQRGLLARRSQGSPEDLAYPLSHIVGLGSAILDWNLTFYR